MNFFPEFLRAWILLMNQYNGKLIHVHKLGCCFPLCQLLYTVYLLKHMNGGFFPCYDVRHIGNRCHKKSPLSVRTPYHMRLVRN